MPNKKDLEAIQAKISAIQNEIAVLEQEENRLQAAFEQMRREYFLTARWTVKSFGIRWGEYTETLAENVSWGDAYDLSKEHLKVDALFLALFSIDRIQASVRSLGGESTLWLLVEEESENHE